MSATTRTGPKLWCGSWRKLSVPLGPSLIQGRRDQANRNKRQPKGNSSNLEQLFIQADNLGLKHLRPRLVGEGRRLHVGWLLVYNYRFAGSGRARECLGRSTRSEHAVPRSEGRLVLGCCDNQAAITPVDRGVIGHSGRQCGSYGVVGGQRLVKAVRVDRGKGHVFRGNR